MDTLTIILAYLVIGVPAVAAVCYVHPPTPRDYPIVFAAWIVWPGVAFTALLEWLSSEDE